MRANTRKCVQKGANLSLMFHQIHTLRLQLNWELINAISKIDRFDASWSSLERAEGRSLKMLKNIATVRSVGASTRIEGSSLSDNEVERLIANLDRSNLHERDQQEVAGYFTTLDLITDSFPEIAISETAIKSLHNNLMRFSTADEWHRGQYKQHSNSVQAQTPDGNTYTIFQTTPPGIATESAMKALVDWYSDDTNVHALIKSAIFCYDFLSIHPFQDGNGRMSRLLSTLLLLKSGYKWIQYVSFEYEIESRKGEYYRTLIDCQQRRPGEEVTTWVYFFLQCLSNIQDQLLHKLQHKSNGVQLSPREQEVLRFVQSHPATGSGKLADALKVSLRTVQQILKVLLEKGLIEKKGIGKATTYSAP